jgi:hypothetical protein
LPKFNDAGAIANCPDAVIVVPVPVRGTCRLGPLEALLVNDSAPETVPLLVGLKATLNDELCPAGIVNGNVAPVRMNCELLVVSADTVTLALVALTVRA